MQRRWATAGRTTDIQRLLCSRVRASSSTCYSISRSFSSPSGIKGGGNGENANGTPEPFLYAGNGSSYYCRDPDPGNRHNLLIHPGKKTLGPYEKEVICNHRRRIVNMKKPPISREQAEKWKLDRLIYKRPVHFHSNKPLPVLLLPPEQRIYSLGPEMDKLDAVYRQKGLFTPSEVAHVFIPIVPTFFVETRYVVERIQPDVLLTLDTHLSRAKFTSIFEHYPMLFKLHRRKFQRSAVKLNDDMWFVRAHPDFQKANVLQREHNVDYKSSVGGVLSSHLPLPSASENGNAAGDANSAADGNGGKVGGPQKAWRPLKIRLFEILVRHLPRVPSSEPDYVAKRHAAVRLIEWINSFPQSEIDTLNQVPPPHLVFLLHQCVHIFQLMGDTPTDTNLFCDREHFIKLPLWKDRFPQMSGETITEETATREEKDPLPAPSQPPPPPPPPPRTDADLLGVDDILLDDGSSTKLPRTIEEEEQELQERYMAEEADGNAAADGEEEEGEERLGGDDEGGNDDDDDGETVSMPVNTPLESIFVRRRPSHMSPRSWSNFDTNTTPEKDIFRLIASCLAPPPSMSKDPTAKANVFHQSVTEIRQMFTKRGELPPPHIRFQLVWRWVLVDELYNLLSPDQRRRLPFYKGLVNFLRLHGEVFELSNDFRYVIAHDPSGIPAPYTPTQHDFSLEERAVLPKDFDADPAATATLIGEEDRPRHAQVLGNSQVPTSRNQLTILDPHNPLLLSDVLHEEVAKLVPARGPIPKARLLGFLPPIMRAAMPKTYNIAANTGITIFRDHGVVCLRRAGSRLGKPTVQKEEEATVTLEEAVEVLRESIPEHGATPRALVRMYLPSEVSETFRKEMGSLLMAVRAYPQYFEIEESAVSPRDCIIRLKEDGQ